MQRGVVGSDRRGWLSLNSRGWLALYGQATDQAALDLDSGERNMHDGVQWLENDDESSLRTIHTTGTVDRCGSGQRLANKWSGFQRFLYTLLTIPSIFSRSGIPSSWGAFSTHVRPQSTLTSPVVNASGRSRVGGRSSVTGDGLLTRAFCHRG